MEYEVGDFVDILFELDSTVYGFCFGGKSFKLQPNKSPEPTAAALFINGFWGFGIHKFFAPWLSFFR
jgi:hypothetical protein